MTLAGLMRSGSPFYIVVSTTYATVEGIAVDLQGAVEIAKARIKAGGAEDNRFVVHQCVPERRIWRGDGGIVVQATKNPKTRKVTQ